MCAKKKESGRYREIRNRKVFREYFVERTLEAGIALVGTEVKSVRRGNAQINDAFARIEKGVVLLYNAHIGEYEYGNLNNHNPTRPRMLLLHKKEIRKLQNDLQSGRKTLVPTRFYFKKGLIKAEIALCTGKKLYDKRQDLRKKAVMREAERDIKFSA